MWTHNKCIQKKKKSKETNLKLKFSYQPQLMNDSFTAIWLTCNLWYSMYFTGKQEELNQEWQCCEWTYLVCMRNNTLKGGMFQNSFSHQGVTEEFNIIICTEMKTDSNLFDKKHWLWSAWSSTDKIRTDWLYSSWQPFFTGTKATLHSIIRF